MGTCCTGRHRQGHTALGSDDAYPASVTLPHDDLGSSSAPAASRSARPHEQFLHAFLPPEVSQSSATELRKWKQRGHYRRQPSSLCRQR